MKIENGKSLASSFHVHPAIFGMCVAIISPLRDQSNDDAVLISPWQSANMVLCFCCCCPSVRPSSHNNIYFTIECGHTLNKRIDIVINHHASKCGTCGQCLVSTCATIAPPPPSLQSHKRVKTTQFNHYRQVVVNISSSVT